MRIKHEKYGDLFHTKGQVWQYWIDTYFAIVPTLLNTGQVFPSIRWLSRYWATYPVDEATGKVIEMYRVVFTKDPRKPKESP